jgi:chaperone modulatory protein CbpM
MERTWIKIYDVCTSHKIEMKFIRDLSYNGLIEVVTEEDVEFIDEEQLLLLEQFASWYYELELNMQGIEVAKHLLSKIQQLQREIALLKSL